MLQMLDLSRAELIRPFFSPRKKPQPEVREITLVRDFNGRCGPLVRDGWISFVWQDGVSRCFSEKRKGKQAAYHSF